MDDDRPADAGPPPGDAAALPGACEGQTEERCDGLDNDCDGDIDEQLACPVPCIGLAIANHGYMFCSASVDFSSARRACAAQGMRLAWLETPTENATLLARLDALVLPGATAIFAFIGASDSGEEGVWRWLGTDTIADGFQFWAGSGGPPGAGPVGGAYANFSDGEPNDYQEQDCALLTLRADPTNDPGQWDDQGCELSYPFVCEEP